MTGIIEINSIGWWLKQHFGTKVIKLALDGGFTCPNRDGTCGTGGCIFCSEEGSGELASSIMDNSDSAPADFNMADAIAGQIELRAKKWPKATHFIAYFQSHTNTYAPVRELRTKFEAALHALDNDPDKNIVGLAIATRPDCLDDDVLDLLSELNNRTFLWVELGLQTIHGDHINRGYELAVYDEAVKKLVTRGIRVVTHLILGLPGERKSDMAESVRYVTKSFAENSSAKHIFGIKLHLLNVVKGSPMEVMYPGYTPFDSPEEYIGLVCDLVEIIPPDITIHRLTGDVPRKLLIAPEWSYKKRTILNGIAHELRLRGSHQGCKL